MTLSQEEAEKNTPKSAAVSLGLCSRSQPYEQFHYKLFLKTSEQNSELINLSPQKEGGARNALLLITCYVPGTYEPHTALGEKIVTGKLRSRDGK